MVNGNLPDGWTWTTLGKLLKVRYGYSFKSDDYQQEGLLLVRQGNLSSNKISKDKAVYLPSHFLNIYPDYRINKGDVLIGMSGSIGKLCVYDLDEPALQNQRTGLLQFFEPDTKDFIKYYFLTLESKFAELAKGVAVQNISAKDIESESIPLPPISEQKFIVAKLDELFTQLEAGTAALKRVQAGLKRYKASVLKAAVSGRLVNGNLEIGDGELPEGWRWTTVGEIGEISGGLTKNSKRDILPKKLPYLRVANVYANELRLDEISEIGIEENEIQRTLLKDGDLLVVEGNGSADQIGRVALWNGSISPCLHQNHIIKVRFEPKEVAEYVLYWLLSDGGREQITSVASSTSGLYTLSLSKVANLKVPLPPLAEQWRIVAEVERRLSVVKEVESVVAASVARASRLRQSVLKSAFEGRLGR